MRIPFSQFLERRFHTNSMKVEKLDLWNDVNVTTYWICFGIAMGYVFVYNIWYMFSLGVFEEEYSRGDIIMAHAGLFIHAICGILLLFCGYLQFNSKARMYYPFLHRVSGYYYLFMSLLMMVGIVIIFISGGSLSTPVSGIWWSVSMLYWIYTHADGLVSIFRKDILRHRRMMFRGFTFANSIIWTRLPVLTLQLVYKLTPAAALATGFWLGAAAAVIVAEIYIGLDKYFMPDPIIYLEDGRSFYTTQSHMPGEGTSPTAVSVLSITPLADDKSLHLTLRIDDCDEMMYFFPGQHVSLRAEGTSAREYSPIVLEQYASRGEIHLWVRLLDNGVMSDVFRAYMKAAKAADLEMNPLARKNKTGGEDPIPASDTGSTAGSLSGPKLSINVSSNRLRYFPGRFKHLILIASGTGLAPLVTLISSIIHNKRDRAHISMVYITRGGEDYGLTLLDTFKGNAQMQLITVEEHPNRVNADDIWRDHVFADGNNGEAGTTLANRANVQVHVSGGPALVKRLYHQARHSSLYNLPRPDEQLVGWGYSDR